jgi:hypothetical protein
MVFNENQIKSLKYRQALNKILENPTANNGERLFLCCFCRDTLRWEESAISNFIHDNNRWSNYDRAKTCRQVNLVFERKAQGLISRKPSKFQGRSFCSSPSSHFQAQGLSETNTGETQAKGKEGEIETVAVATSNGNDENLFFPSRVFFVSPIDREKCFREVRVPEDTEEEKTTMEETKIYGKLNNGNRYYRVVEKSGKYGAFLSIDSGPLMEATSETGEPLKAFGRPDKYFSLPKEPEDIQKLISILQKTISEEPIKEGKKGISKR